MCGNLGAKQEITKRKKEQLKLVGFWKNAVQKRPEGDGSVRVQNLSKGSK